MGSVVASVGQGPEGIARLGVVICVVASVLVIVPAFVDALDASDSWADRNAALDYPARSVPYEEAVVTLHFEFDQISSPGNKVDYEIEATAPGSSAHNIERALHQFLSHVGINSQPTTVRHTTEPAITNSAGAQG